MNRSVSNSIFRKIILLLGAILGFSSSIVAQYGAPMAQYKISGTVTAKDCEVTIPKIKIKYSENNQNKYYSYPVYTDSSGQFEFYIYEDYGIPVNGKTIFIFAEDEDGEENSGHFLNLEKKYILKQKKGGSSYDGAFTEIEVEMDCKGKSPCLTELPIDSMHTEPVIQKICILTDSILPPGDPGSSLSFISPNETDSIVIQNSFAPSFEFLEKILVYPNPSDGKFRVQCTFSLKTEVIFYLYDANMKQISAENTGKHEGTFNKSFDLTAQAPGTYFLIVIADEKQYFEKIVKQ